MSKGYQLSYKSLEEQYNELLDHMHDIDADRKQYITELNYYSAFVEWKGLKDEFDFFKENAFEKYDEDLPFPYLTI